MIVNTLTLGPMQANCYLLECEETLSAVVIDPGDDADVILNILEECKLNLELIINTHGHVDHIAANSDLKQKTNAQLCIHKLDADMIVNPQKNLSSFIGRAISSSPASKILKDGDILEAGMISLKVIHTPGHSPGSICLLTDEAIFTGDLLFAGGIGRYDFPGSSYEQIINSLKKIMELDDNIEVYPGHGPITTIGEERSTNLFL